MTPAAPSPRPTADASTPAYAPPAAPPAAAPPAAPRPIPPASLAAPPDPTAPRVRPPLLGALAGAAVGAAVGAGATIAAKRLLGDLPSIPSAAKPGVLVALPLVVFLVILAHELGHLAAGWLAGTRAQMLVVGPLMVVRGPAGWRVRRNRAVSLAGGLALTAPHGPMAADVERVRRAMRIVVIGGPAASVLFAALAAALAFAGRGPGGATARAVWVAACAITAVMSAGIALVCLLPMRAGGLDTDGRQALDLRPGSPAAARKAARTAIVSLDLSGVRPRDWPAPLAAALTRDLDPSEPAANVTAHLLAAAHAFDAGRPAEGRAHLARALAARSALPRPLRGGMLREAAWVAARVDHDAAGARALLAEAAAGGPGMDLAPYQQPMAEAAVRWLDGDAPAARRALAAARAALADAPALTGGSAALVRDRLDALAAEVDAAGAGAAER